MEWIVCRIARLMIMLTSVVVVALSFTSASYAFSDNPSSFAYINSQANEYQDPNAVTMAADLAIARPLGIAATAVGAIFFVVSLPFSILGGNVNQSAEQLVGVPAETTFKRCLGCAGAG